MFLWGKLLWNSPGIGAGVLLCFYVSVLVLEKLEENWLLFQPHSLSRPQLSGAMSPLLHAWLPGLAAGAPGHAGAGALIKGNQEHSFAAAPTGWALMGGSRVLHEKKFIFKQIWEARLRKPNA